MQARREKEKSKVLFLYISPRVLLLNYAHMLTKKNKSSFLLKVEYICKKYISVNKQFFFQSGEHVVEK